LFIYEDYKLKICDPQTKTGARGGVQSLTEICRKKHFKIFFSRSSAPKMPIFTQKLGYIVKILNYKNRYTQTKTGAPGGVQCLTKKYIENMF